MVFVARRLCVKELLLAQDVVDFWFRLEIIGKNQIFSREFAPNQLLGPIGVRLFFFSARFKNLSESCFPAPSLSSVLLTNLNGLGAKTCFSISGVRFGFARESCFGSTITFTRQHFCSFDDSFEAGRSCGCSFRATGLSAWFLVCPRQKLPRCGPPATRHSPALARSFGVPPKYRLVYVQSARWLVKTYSSLFPAVTFLASVPLLPPVDRATLAFHASGRALAVRLHNMVFELVP